jgi:hypothetical protein
VKLPLTADLKKEKLSRNKFCLNQFFEVKKKFTYKAIGCVGCACRVGVARVGEANRAAGRARRHHINVEYYQSRFYFSQNVN